MTGLPLFDDGDARRVLCVAAHPDDLEYGASAAVARWTARGVHVGYLLLTAGEAGMRSRDPDEARPIRIAEQRTACAAAGVDDLVVLDLPDGALEPSLDLRRHVARRIRALRPDVVLVPTWALEVPWGLNHADHRATGITVVDAIRDADNPWTFQELRDLEGLEPWAVTWLLVVGDEPDHLLDVSGRSVDRAVASLEAHAAYLAELADHPEPRTLVEGVTADAALRSDDPRVTHALGVRVHRMA